MNGLFTLARNAEAEDRLQRFTFNAQHRGLSIAQEVRKTEEKPESTFLRVRAI